MPRRHAVRITANFERNVAEIRDYLDSQEAGAAFAALLDYLFDTVIPNLEHFPDIGRDFLDRSPLSVEGRAPHAKAIRLAGKRWRVREYIAGDYLVLYGAGKEAVVLLAIRHHRQLSFDLRGHWPG